jgi:RNA polymerase sigma factor (sigma-70 family)
MDDIEFIRKCAAGDIACREEFVRKYTRLMYNYIIKVTHARSKKAASHSVDDIFQDLICHLFSHDAKRLRSFSGKNGCSAATWLRLVTIHFTCDYLCKRSEVFSMNDPREEDDEHLLQVIEDNSLDARNAALAAERMDNLRDCIDVLPEDDRYFINLHIHRGVALDDLAVHLKKTRGALDVYKTRLLNRLRECFKRKGLIFS